MEDQASVEMPTGLDSSHIWKYGFSGPRYELLLCCLIIGTVNPLLVFRRDVNGTVEGLGPLRVRGIVVRMRDLQRSGSKWRHD